MLYNGAELSAKLNPLAQAVSVQMTAAASGSNGIRQLDNDNLDMGTNDYTLHWEGSLPDWTPADNVRLVFKVQDVNNRVSFGVSAGSTGTLTTIVVKAGVVVFNLASTLTAGITDGASAKVSVVVVRETASTAGSVTFYVNGVQLGAAVAIAAAATTDISNTGSTFQLSAGGTAGTDRAAGSLQASRLFNRALTAAEVLDLSINGVALADRGASQTERVTNGTFDSDLTGWIIGSSAAAVWDSGEAEVSVSGSLTASANNWFSQESAFIFGKLFEVSFDATYISGPDLGAGYGFNQFTTITAAENGGVKKNYKVAVAIVSTTGLSDVNRLTFGRSGAAGTAVWKVDNVKVRQTGLTSELIASNAQSNTGQIFDTSGNKNHALLPASGATVVGRPVSQTREVRWTNTWDGTNELQYIGGVNQAIIPANAYIESIVGTVSGATPHDIIVGDGSDTDRYVALTTGLAAGVVNFTLTATPFTDGTNLKLTVDPDTDCSMSIAWLIRFSTLEA
jgi:hypothetical protein